MDEHTTLSALKDRVKEFCKEREWDQYHTPKDLAIGLLTESSELIEHFRFKSDEEIKNFFDDPKKRIEICEELSDVFYFVLRFAQKYDIDLSYELKNKMKKNAEKYPVELCKGSNKKYNEL
jgi:NTP pyrophosphatase (non-canonical NTP hydrolase)